MHPSLPKNREAEQVILGCCIVEPSRCMADVNHLSPRDFYFRPHQIVFETLQELYIKDHPIDLITLGNRLDEREKLADVGGRLFLTDLVGTVTTTTSSKYYGEIVKKKSTLRNIAQAGAEVADTAYDENLDLKEVISIVQDLIWNATK